MCDGHGGKGLFEHPERSGNLEKLLTVSDASEFLQTSRRTVHKLCREGKLQYIQLTPRERRFTIEQLQSFIASRTLTPPKTVDVSTPPLLPSPRNALKSQRGDRARIRKEMRQWR